MSKTALFAGTTEGRGFLEAADGRGDITVFVATAYGASCLKKVCCPGTEICVGRLDAEEMKIRFQKEKFDFVVDATHPHADAVTKNIKKACAETGIRYIRIKRDEEKCSDACVRYFKDIESISDYLKTHEGKALLATGSKTLRPYTRVPGYEERFYLRILPGTEAVRKAEEAGFKGKHLIAMQGPFSEEMNTLLLKETGARYFVTKDSGAAGGFPEKIAAARCAGAQVLAVSRKEESGVTQEIAAEMIFGKRTQVSLIGIGPGNEKDMTLRAVEAVEKADILIGAPRMLENFDSPHKEVFALYRPERIMEVIRKKTGKNIAVLYSGDTGFHSGAAGLIKHLEKENSIRADVICGVSSISTFAAKIGKSYDDAELLSLHGEKAPVIAALLQKGKVFVLMDYKETIESVFTALREMGLSGTYFAAASRLGYREECIVTGRVGEAETFPETFTNLSVLYLECGKENGIVSSGLPDTVFKRGNIPMTKREIRSVILSLLELKKTDVLYDIGAGTGSVSCEAARLLKEGRVLAAERKKEGTALIEENRRQLRLTNLSVYHGEAPDIIDDMEKEATPTCAFIGGSGGKIRAVLDRLLRLNAEMRIVVSAITPETLGEVTLYAQGHHIEAETVLIQSARSRPAGRTHLMTGMNPVWIVTLKGEKKNEI